MKIIRNRGRPQNTSSSSGSSASRFDYCTEDGAPSPLWLNLFRLLLALLLGFWVYSSEQARQQHQLARLQSLSASLTERITATIHHSTLALYPLGSLTLQHGKIPELAALARQMRHDMPAILNVAVMPAGVVRQIEPLGPHAEAIGHDMLSDPKRRPEAMRAINSGELTISGPYELIQGGGGLVARLPLFKHDRFWGFVSIVYDFPAVLETLGLSELRNQGVQFRIGDQLGGRFREIIANTEQLPSPSVHKVIALPNNQWSMEMAFTPHFNWLLPAKLLGALGCLWLGSLLFGELLRGMGQRKMLEHTRARHQQLTERHSSQQRLLARVSHDLRAPLQHVLNELRQLTREQDSITPVRTIEQNMRYQLDLIEQLLEYTASPTRVQASHPNAGYLYRFLSDIVEQAGFLARSHDNRLHSDVAFDLPGIILADFHQLQRVLINLLSNAAKYTLKGNIYFRVHAVNPMFLRFTVEDTGPGMHSSPKRAPGQREGIGLMIVSDLLHLMDTQLHYRPRDEGGSRFYFDLPLAQPDGEASPEPFIESHITDWQGDDLRILVADSDATVREGLHELLAGYGCTVRTCAGCREAAAALASGQFELVITEQRLRDGHGQVLLTKARSQPQPPQVLLYSQWPVPASDQNGDWHYHAALLKPATSLQLLHTIHRLCQEPTNTATD